MIYPAFLISLFIPKALLYRTAGLFDGHEHCRDVHCDTIDFRGFHNSSNGNNQQKTIILIVIIAIISA